MRSGVRSQPCDGECTGGQVIGGNNILILIVLLWRLLSVKRQTLRHVTQKHCSLIIIIAGVMTTEETGENWIFRVDMLSQRGMTSTLT